MTAGRFLFVGERRSPRAVQLGYRLCDGRLAGQSLFAALEACGIDPRRHVYCNLFERGGARLVVEHQAAGAVVVGMGRKVQAELRRRGIAHLALVHPAARGRIRKRARYAAHVRRALVRA